KESLLVISKLLGLAISSFLMLLNRAVASPIAYSICVELVNITEMVYVGFELLLICRALITGITQILSPPKPELDPFFSKTPIILNLSFPIVIILSKAFSFGKRLFFIS